MSLSFSTGPGKYRQFAASFHGREVALVAARLTNGSYVARETRQVVVWPFLKLSGEITDLMEQGRSAGISMWNNTQRPAGIPLSIYVNSHLAFLFQTQEEYDVDRLKRLKTKHTTMQELVYNLDSLDSIETHEFVFLDRSGKIPPVRSIVSRKGSRPSGSKTHKR